MKRKIYSVSVAVFAFVFCCAGKSFSANSSEAEYRKQWMKTERTYTKQTVIVSKEEERMHDIMFYLENGKTFMEKKDYPSALICFRNIIELENNAPHKMYTQESEIIIKELERNMNRAIEEELGQKFKQDWDRLKAGSTKILSRVPKDHIANLEHQQKIAIKEQQKLDEKEALKKELELKQKEYEKEMEKKKLTLESELKMKKTALLKKKEEIAKLTATANEMLANGSLKEASSLADKVLSMEAGNPAAKEIKNNVLIAQQKEEYEAKKKELDAQRTANEQKLLMLQAEEEKKRMAEREKQQEAIIYLDKAKELLKKHKYVEAVAELETANKIDPENFEAKELLTDIKDNLKKAVDILNNSPSSSAESQDKPSDSVKLNSSGEINQQQTLSVSNNSSAAVSDTKKASVINTAGVVNAKKQ